MLDVIDQPAGLEERARKSLEKAENDPWDQIVVNEVLLDVAASLSDRGEYFHDNLAPEGSASTKPILSFAPALILRRRTQRGLLEVLKAMRTRIPTIDNLPPEFHRLCEGRAKSEESDGLPGNDGEPACDDVGRIHFPLPTNEEQRRIVKAITAKDSVLVQGPPGTGKSHTIANLICHFLATGQRILVTAQTPRALEVLQRKLPEEVRPLCVSLLGSGAKERNELERSVRGILNHHSNWRPDVNERDRSRLEDELTQAQSDHAEIGRKLVSIRERETRTFSFADGAYQGTAGRIGEAIRRDERRFSWFVDEPPEDGHRMISANQLQEFRQLLLKYPPHQQTLLRLRLPDEKLIPSERDFHDAVKHERSLTEKVSSVAPRLDTPTVQLLLKMPAEIVRQIESKLSALIRHVAALRTSHAAWQSEASTCILTGNFTVWKELYDQSARILQNQQLPERARLADQTDVALPAVEMRQIEADAARLLDHLKAGGSLGWGPFRPKVVREVKYLVEHGRINGVRCDQAESLQQLLNHLQTLREIDLLWKLWERHMPRRGGSHALQVHELYENTLALRNCFDLVKLRRDALESCKQIPSMARPHLATLEEITVLLSICGAVVDRADLQSAADRLEYWMRSIAEFAASGGAHPISSELAECVRQRDHEMLRKTAAGLEDLCKQAFEVVRFDQLRSELAPQLPLLLSELDENPGDPKWENRISELEAASYWAQARKWLREFNSLDLDALQRQSLQLEEEIGLLQAKLAANLAWSHCFHPKRMSSNHREHMVGWQLAMDKYGKGTGKHAGNHLRNAQRHMDECKGAIPAWVMPLYRTYEMITAQPEMFDVIVVDEASQCGPEALPLLFLGKKILVVGDDKQISPEGSFIDGAEVQSLIQQYLYDFEHRDSFDPSTSLFDHAIRRFRKTIPLREHFRSMPEIIRFSNDLCYQATPLIPLRQYPPNRLDPLLRYPVSGGFREGSGQNVFNRPEAKAIVDRIIECCRDARYTCQDENGRLTKRTMGVIVLQGKGQARLIEQMLRDQLGDEEVEDRRIVCGEPYSFQGDERDVIFLSLVAAPNEIIGTLTKKSDERRFNVAASRARDQMWLFHSATIDDLSPQCFRRLLLEYFLNPMSVINKALGDEAEHLQQLAARANRGVEKPPRPFDSWFELDVALTIASRGYRVVPQYPIGNKRIDLMIEGAKSSLAVECYGDAWHGPERFEEDAYRQRTLERQGWRFWIVRDSVYSANPERAMAPLWTELQRLGIDPVAKSKPISSRIADRVG